MSTERYNPGDLGLDTRDFRINGKRYSRLTEYEPCSDSGEDCVLVKANPYETWKPHKLDKAPSYSARLFVGMNVNKVPTWNKRQVKAAAFIFRRNQIRDGMERGILPEGSTVSFTLFAAEGVFDSDAGKADDEETAEIFIVRMYREETSRVFHRNMMALAQSLATFFHQSSVLLLSYERGKLEEQRFIESEPPFAPMSETKQELKAMIKEFN